MVRNKKKERKEGKKNNLTDKADAFLYSDRLIML